MGSESQWHKRYGRSSWLKRQRHQLRLQPTVPDVPCRWPHRASNLRKDNDGCHRVAHEPPPDTGRGPDGSGVRAWGNRRLERPDPPRLSHDGPGLATPRPQGRHDRSDFSKKCSGLSPFRVLSLEGASPLQHPPAARLRRPLGSHRGSRATSFLASTCDRRAATKPEPMGSATPANTGPTPLSSPFM
jgi:hypothetical protein